MLEKHDVNRDLWTSSQSAHTNTDGDIWKQLPISGYQINPWFFQYCRKAGVVFKMSESTWYHTGTFDNPSCSISGWDTQTGCIHRFKCEIKIKNQVNVHFHADLSDKSQILMAWLKMIKNHHTICTCICLSFQLMASVQLFRNLLHTSSLRLWINVHKMKIVIISYGMKYMSSKHCYWDLILSTLQIFQPSCD